MLSIKLIRDLITQALSEGKNFKNGIPEIENIYDDNFQWVKENAISTDLRLTELENKKDYHVYSTDEKVVGKWIDGKPIYEFTFEVTHQGQGQKYYTVPHDITNVNFVGIEQYCIFPTTNNISPLPYATGDIYTVVRKEQNNILVSTLIDRTGTKIVTTIRYTKNTDTPNA